MPHIAPHYHTREPVLVRWYYIVSTRYGKSKDTGAVFVVMVAVM